MENSAMDTIAEMTDEELLFAAQEYDPEYRHLMDPESLPLLDAILAEIEQRGLK
ncbi:hypothetical protein [Streptomyces noursei]|uniref:hypothetical protein n=1 Tax=Streptomyces noursei TaxID=1971 RepID=UPI0037FBCF8C